MSFRIKYECNKTGLVFTQWTVGVSAEAVRNHFEMQGYVVIEVRQ
jgi:hypothetical protein